MFAPQWADGTFALLVSFILVNLLLLVEVADRLSLKGELEVAREIQLAMLPTGTYSAGDADICGVTRPANTVGGDFYDVLPLADGRVIVTIGDVAGKGSPAALLMALLLAVLRTLVDEKLEPCALVARLNTQICRHSPGSRFITLFYGDLHAGHRRAHLRERGAESAAASSRRRIDRAARRDRHRARDVRRIDLRGGRERSCARATSWCCTATASPRRRTRPASPSKRAASSASSRRMASRHRRSSRPAILRAVEAHARDSRFTDDLTVLILKRCLTGTATFGCLILVSRCAP